MSDEELDALHGALTRTPAEDPAPEPEPEPEPQPEPAPQPTPNPQPHISPYNPWAVVSQRWPSPQPSLRPQPQPQVLAYDYRYALPRSESYALPYDRVYDLSQREPYALTYGNVSAVSRAQVRTSQPFATVAQPSLAWHSLPAHSVVGPTASRTARSLWRYAYPYDTTVLPNGYPSYYYGNRTRAYRRSRANAWSDQLWAYGTTPFILGSRANLYPWQWDWWA